MGGLAFTKLWLDLTQKSSPDSKTWLEVLVNRAGSWSLSPKSWGCLLKKFSKQDAFFIRGLILSTHLNILFWYDSVDCRILSPCVIWREIIVYTQHWYWVEPSLFHSSLDVFSFVIWATPAKKRKSRNSLRNMGLYRKSTCRWTRTQTSALDLPLSPSWCQNMQSKHSTSWMGMCFRVDCCTFFQPRLKDLTRRELWVGEFYPNCSNCTGGLGPQRDEGSWPTLTLLSDWILLAVCMAQK